MPFGPPTYSYGGYLLFPNLQSALVIELSSGLVTYTYFSPVIQGHSMCHPICRHLHQGFSIGCIDYLQSSPTHRGDQDIFPHRRLYKAVPGRSPKVTSYTKPYSYWHQPLPCFQYRYCWRIYRLCTVYHPGGSTYHNRVVDPALICPFIERSSALIMVISAVLKLATATFLDSRLKSMPWGMEPTWDLPNKFHFLYRCYRHHGYCIRIAIGNKSRPSVSSYAI